MKPIQPASHSTGARLPRVMCLLGSMVLAPVARAGEPPKIEGFTVNSIEALPPPEPRRVRQPVHEYFTVFDPQSAGRQKIEERINPFVAYTHLGTDFGFIGTGQRGIGWEVGTVSINMPGGVWGGMWHSLEGLGSDLDQTLDSRACYPPFIATQFQPKIVGLEVRGKGKGSLKLELKSALQQTLWEKMLTVDSPDMRTFMEDIDPAKI